MQSTHTPVTVLGLGAMGRALAAALIEGGHPVTVWNRTPGRDTALTTLGARGAATAAEAVRGAGLVIVCLFDHASVHETLDPVAADLTGAAVLNLTSTTPDEARELARWATDHALPYLDGGIMAIPEMIGQPGSSILYSGARAVFDIHRPALELLGTAEYFGDDAGTASLYDFALLAAMYTMFAGFLHGAAMMRSAGVSAAEFADRVVPWVTAMSHGTIRQGHTIDTGDYGNPVQTLSFHKSAVDAIVRATRDAGVGTELLAALKAQIDRQVADGHGGEAFERIVEGLAA
ncbi:NAD(P)-dependent oxidoreductase [Nocardia terpenica]|uniref:NAD(P)-dependent oxidoreductase n=1 Tax=Nocardia terpenica TaxID=455432 RepID=A0A6G9Z4W8_9NOCA|nr:NAD(P)-binding domain-containing protein [Nocardia terpenica]QIS20226.1 NAD(P)-dependent oxidoreductase [Nocardia terpenica]